MSEEKVTFEEAFKKLEEASEKLKSHETSLEDAIKNYEEGVTAYKVCRDILDDAEQRIDKLIEK